VANGSHHRVASRLALKNSPPGSPWLDSASKTMPKPKQRVQRSQRKRQGREFTLSKALNERLDDLQDRGEKLASIAEEALRAHPKVNLPPEHEES
jgi:hypothetical protein